MDFPLLSHIPAFVMPLMDGDLSDYLQSEKGRVTPIRSRMQYVSLGYRGKYTNSTLNSFTHLKLLEVLSALNYSRSQCNVVTII